MKQLLALASALLLCFGAASVQAHDDATPKQAKAKAQILQAYKDWDQALIKADKAALERLLGDSYIQTSEEGATADKARSIEMITSGEDLIPWCETSRIHVHFYGKTAVVTGVWTAKMTNKGKDLSGAFAFTDVWVKKGKGWECVADHLSRVKEQK